MFKKVIAVAKTIYNYRYLLGLNNVNILRISGHDKNNRLDYGNNFQKLNNVLLIRLFKVAMKRNAGKTGKRWVEAEIKFIGKSCYQIERNAQDRRLRRETVHGQCF